MLTSFCVVVNNLYMVCCKCVIDFVPLDNRTLVTISPGVTTGELMQFFLLQGVCFESDVILPTVTYGGVLSGGCHVS